MAIKKDVKKPATKKPAAKVSGKTPVPKGEKKPSPVPPKFKPKSVKVKVEVKGNPVSKKKSAPTPAKKNLGGRPTKYNDDLHPKLVKYLMMQGKTIPEACEEMGISTSTYWLWSTEHERFSIAINEAKEKADAIVEASLYRMATGYEHEVEKPMIVGTGMGESQVEVVKYTERLPPNPTAMIFWLKNRKPKEWRDKQEIGITDKDGNDRSFTVNFVKPE